MTLLPPRVRPRLLIIDLEATCWERGRHRPSQMETIEIGAVLARSDTLEWQSELTTFVRPIQHPILSEFCRNLTTIRQEDVNRAPVFGEALDGLLAWVGPLDDVTFGSWGAYDRKQLLRDCSNHRIRYPFGEEHEHFNIKEHVAQIVGWRPRGLAPAAGALGINFEGTHHRGIDDARNILRVLRVVHGLSPEIET